AAHRERRTTFGHEHERGFGRLALDPAQGPQLDARQRVNRGRAVLAAIAMDLALVEVDRVPAQGPRTMAAKPFQLWGRGPGAGGQRKRLCAALACSLSNPRA